MRKPDWLLSTAHRVRTFFVTESVQIDPFACADVTAFAEAMDQLLVSDLVVIVPNSTGSSGPALAEFASALVSQTRPSLRYAVDLGSGSCGLNADRWAELWSAGVFVTRSGSGGLLTIKRHSSELTL